MDVQLIWIDCGDHEDFIARGHIDREAFAEAVVKEGWDRPDLDDIQHGFARILPGGRFGASSEFDQFYRTCPDGGRGAARVTALCPNGSCCYVRKAAP